MTGHPHIAEQLFGRPLLLSDTAAATVVDAFARFDADSVAGRLVRPDASPAASLAEGLVIPPALAARPNARSRLDALSVDGDVVTLDGGRGSYGLTTGGVAIIPIVGELSPRWTWRNAYSGLTSYDTLREIYAAVSADSRVRAALLDIDSPGGLAIDCAQTAHALERLAAEKPVWACANGIACSAAYWNAAPAARLTVTPAGVTGSIGAVVVLRDETGADDKAGFKYRYIRSGDLKAAVNPHETPSDETLSRLQSEADRLRDEFSADVARLRASGGLTLDAVLATRSAILSDRDAVQAKIADASQTLEETLAELTEAVAPRSAPPSTRTGEPSMRKPAATLGEVDDPENDDAPPPDDTQPAKKPDDDGTDIPPETAVDPVAAARAQASAAGVSPAMVDALLSAGAVAERTRLSDIDAATLPGCEALAADAKQRGLPVGAFNQRQVTVLRGVGSGVLSSLRAAGSEQPVVPPAPPALSAAVDPVAAWDRDPVLRAEFGGEKSTYEAFLKATTSGIVRGL